MLPDEGVAPQGELGCDQCCATDVQALLTVGCKVVSGTCA